MATSLARQLKGLRSQQSDTLKVPIRTKVSFLFDIKEAYKIEDEVIYTLCLKGIDELGSQFPKLKLQLDSYREDLFYDGAVEFYRGSLQKETVEKLDRKLTDVITLISPYFMNAASYKIIEFLMRIFEIHGYHKTHMFFSFLPFYDTPQFLRLIQCMELKSDPMLSFFEPFAKKGTQLRLEALTRFMARENGAYLKVLSNIVFKFLEFRDDFTSLTKQIQDKKSKSLMSQFDGLQLDDEFEKVPHYRFWGTLVFKIISTEESSRSESYLYTLIPSLAKALDCGVLELQVGALSIISILSEKIPFSSQYMNAFLTEICKSASNSLDSSDSKNYFSLSVKTCLRILHSQQVIPKLNDRLSMYSFNLGSSKYTINPDDSSKNKTKEDGKYQIFNLSLELSYKWISDLAKHQDQFIKFFK